jgi:solute carrier family 31 (copper transporter), member 1
MTKQLDAAKPPPSSTVSVDKETPTVEVKEIDSSTGETLGDASDCKSQAKHRRRTFAPFILAHDAPRGAIHALQALLGYILMLSVMRVSR